MVIMTKIFGIILNAEGKAMDLRKNIGVFSMGAGPVAQKNNRFAGLQSVRDSLPCTENKKSLRFLQVYVFLVH